MTDNRSHSTHVDPVPQVQTAELTRSLNAARARGVTVRALVVINPGNPTGNALPEEDMRAVLEFAQREGLVLLADEVYQENIWEDGFRWRSFKHVACKMGLVDPEASAVHASLQLVSFQSVSKGFTGECGRRGGYMELVGFEPAVRAELYKLASVNLCRSVGCVLGVSVSLLTTVGPCVGHQKQPLCTLALSAATLSVRSPWASSAAPLRPGTPPTGDTARNGTPYSRPSSAAP